MLVPPAATVTVTRVYPEALQASVTGEPQLVAPPPPLLPVPLTETGVLVAVPPSPTTVYVYETAPVPVFAGRLSVNDAGIGVCPFAVDMAVVELVPLQLEIVPQLLAVTVTCPPALVSVDGDADTEHDGVVVPPPGDVQETTRFPLLGATETVNG